MTKATNFYFWRIDCPFTGKRRTTDYRMTDEMAAERYPGAERLDDTLEVRHLPENDAEIEALSLSRLLNRRASS